MLARPEWKTQTKLWQTQQSCPALSTSQERVRESCCKLFGLVPPPLCWSNLFWPTPFFWVALLKQHLQGGPPASSLYRNLGEAKREKKKKSMKLLLMSLQDAVSRRPKEFFKIPADSPHTSNASQKGEMMDISEEIVTWFSYKQDNSCKQESKSEERLSPLWFGGLLSEMCTSGAAALQQ